MDCDAIVNQLMGDEVIGLFLPRFEVGWRREGSFG
jgi:hypothetical protein